MTSPQRVRTLITSFQYGKLKSAGTIPNITMFNDIVKKGGSFPKIARKITSSLMGIATEHAISHVLDTRSSLTIERLQSIGTQLGIPNLESDHAWFLEKTNLILSKISDQVEIEPEWQHGNVQGHPDIVTNDTIYDIKTTGLFGKMRIPTIFQLLSYYSLAQAIGKVRRYVGLILPAQDLVVRIDMKEWNGEKFLALLESTAIEKCEGACVRHACMTHYMIKVNPYVGTHVKALPTLFDTVQQQPPHLPIQIFFAGNFGISRANRDKPFKFTDYDIAKTTQFITDKNIKMFIHSPYSINLGRPDEWIGDILIKDIKLAETLMCKGVVVHIGHKVELKIEDALENMRQQVIRVVTESATESCPLLIETDSGGSILDNPEDLAKFYLNLPDNVRKCTGICLDTCHVFAAGYDIMKTLHMFNKFKVPVKLIHYNDSKHAYGSKLDRHMSLGTGMIPFNMIYETGVYAQLEGIPLVRE